MARTLAILLALALLLGLGAGCKKETPELPPGEVTAPAETDPVIIDAQPGVDDLFTLVWTPASGANPFTCTAGYNRQILPLLYEGLFCTDAAFEAQPLLCETHSVSEDGLTWTLHLAERKFSDGSPVTAQDVLASLTAARESAAYSARFSCISEITAAGTRILHIKLTSPNARLSALLDIPVVKAGTESAAQPTGSGPYTLLSAGSIYLSANRQHPDFEQLPLQRIFLRSFDEDSLSTDFGQGLVDLFMTDLDTSRSIHFLGRPEVRHSYSRSFYYLGFNLAEGRPYAMAEARQDISRCLDRHGLQSTAFSGNLTVSALPAHPALQHYDTALAAKYDRPEADISAYFLSRLYGDYDDDGLLEMYADGQILDLEVDFIVCKEDLHKLEAARSIARSLAAADYPVILRELSYSDYMAALQSGNFDLYLAETVLTPDFDLRPLVGTGGAINYGGISDTRLDNLLSAYMAAGAEDLPTAATRLWSRLCNQAYILPIGFTERALYTHRGVVSGLSPTSENVFYGIADWSVDLTEE